MQTNPINKDLINKGVWSRFMQILAVFVVLAAALFLSRGTLQWGWGWTFLGIYLASVLINATFLMRHHLETVAERGRPKEMKKWDQWISGLWSLAQFFLVPLAAGLDLRFGWTEKMANIWHFGGVLIFALGLGLFSWAMVSNAYFSTIVRIQTERGHSVCQSGPYRWVRHPGYVGAILQSVGMPLLLGSYWAFLPAFVAIAAMVVRTVLEDRTLQLELEGYREFSQAVRYRLVPGIW